MWDTFFAGRNVVPDGLDCGTEDEHPAPRTNSVNVAATSMMIGKRVFTDIDPTPKYGASIPS
jgi:hypothetical protein